jgi:hypothetical protein
MNKVESRPIESRQNIESIESLMSAEELAEALNVGVSWVYYRIHTKSMPEKLRPLYVGRYPRWRRQDVRRFLEQGSTEA